MRAVLPRPSARRPRARLHSRALRASPGSSSAPRSQHCPEDRSDDKSACRFPSPRGDPGLDVMPMMRASMRAKEHDGAHDLEARIDANVRRSVGATGRRGGERSAARVCNGDRAIGPRSHAPTASSIGVQRAHQRALGGGPSPVGAPAHWLASRSLPRGAVSRGSDRAIPPLTRRFRRRCLRNHRRPPQALTVVPAVRSANRSCASRWGPREDGVTSIASQIGAYVNSLRLVTDIM